MNIDEGTIEAIASVLAGAERITVLTGAGLSAESGVPTFRDAQTGLWAKYDPAELATPEALARNPETVTRWYDWRRQLIARCEPNPAHAALAALQRWAEGNRVRVDLVTQNVDGLLQRAGATGVVELHGNIHRWRCAATGRDVPDPPLPFAEYPPRTPEGTLLRPGVVWFGEALPAEALAAASEAASSCDVFLSIGTSAMVYPAAGLLHVAADNGARTVEINAERTPATPLVDIAVTSRAGEVLPRIVDRLSRAV